MTPQENHAVQTEKQDNPAELIAGYARENISENEARADGLVEEIRALERELEIVRALIAADKAKLRVLVDFLSQTEQVELETRAA